MFVGDTEHTSYTKKMKNKKNMMNMDRFASAYICKLHYKFIEIGQKR